MNDYDPASPHGTSATSGPSVAGRSGGAVRRLLSNRRSRWIGFAALMCGVIGLSAGWAASPAAAASPSAAPSPSPTASPSPTGARSGPAPGGVWGTVGSVSASSFTVSTLGQTVIVDEASATKYRQGKRPTWARAITAGEPVLVLGTVTSTTNTIAATQVILEPAGGTTPSAAGVVPTQPGAPPVSKTVGQIPANYTQGSGTIVTGRAANKATEASLRAYPGGIADRVVELSNGEYEVHNIGVAWPHHVFVTEHFKVVGAF
jgi:hypothetical protein